MGDGQNQLEEGCAVVSGGVWKEEVSTGNTNLEDGKKVDVKDEVRSPEKRLSGLDAIHTGSG